VVAGKVFWFAGLSRHVWGIIRPKQGSILLQASLLGFLIDLE
jgi:hypothetical protein